ncbi:hypothetical protein BZG01_01565 [Labilibaculum manganireducens]|uniref:DUF4412 domain-containing protein n=1 Tax=Labilibaculum manganireducens TaxID=1940525 RepID=A0A2N3IFD1_9BACT|nr:hypothetical protein [Labilibaculum manganireducens]PKQ69020.1 hypothetical protein BZG01_01565 [Labilibaculum manganireducens]
MKNRLKYLTLVVFSIALFSCDKDDDLQSKDIKRYNVETGIVHYETSISGPYVNGSGTEDLYFKKWGALEMNFEDKSETITIINVNGIEESTTTNARNAYKIDNEKIYVVDYKHSIIYTKEDPLIDYMRQNNLDALEAGKETMISMGGVQMDNEDVLGYDCEVWDLLGVKQWIYKGLTLKIVTSMAGITIIKEATSIKFDVSVADSYFELPNFPHKDISDL